MVGVLMSVGVMTVGVMTVGVMSVGEITVGVMTVGVMRRPRNRLQNILIANNYRISNFEYHHIISILNQVDI
jgi:ABC-type transport system involved in cytochrome c biogenesis permease subunit